MSTFSLRLRRVSLGVEMWFQGWVKVRNVEDVPAVKVFTKIEVQG